MAEKEEFDISKLLTDTISVQANATSPVRMMFPSVQEDPYLKICSQDPFEILGEKSFGQPRKISECTVGTPIQEFFQRSNIFITGGTGFIGKILTEKLIRSVPHLEHIYLLIRSKWGKSSQERFDTLLDDPVFMRMKTEVPEYGTKISVVDGDLSSPNLGLSSADRHLLSDKIHVVIHSAADVRFVEPLRVAVTSNVLGSKYVLDLAKQMRSLKSYVHVSTAYSQCVRRVIEENVPKVGISYQEILNLIETSTDADLENELPRIIKGWPNTYTFSKAVCEEMIQEESESLPICIVRPSIVLPTYKEPVRGWTDNINGPCGLFLGGGVGVLHCIRLSKDLPTDLVPVDYVVNCIIAAAWRTGTSRENDHLPVYNFTSSPNKLICWKILLDSKRYYKFWPVAQAIWYPSFFSTSSHIVATAAHFFLHKIPAKVLDTLASLSGRKPRLTKIFKKLETLKDPLDYFIHTTWEFKNDNVIDLWNKLNEDDKHQFWFDLSDVDITELVLVSSLGVRYYFLKETMESIPYAQFKLKCLYWAHNSLMLGSGLVVLKMLVWVANVLPV